MEALRGYASQEGYEVLEEVSDAGQSGATLERPGMDRVRDLVRSGGITAVLAQDRDRFAREPAYLYLLRQEFAEYGTTLKALNDRGDGNPEGELTDGILDQLAKFERAKMAERTRRGRVRKAREGKPRLGGPPSYGFKHNDSKDGYEIEPDEMRVVWRIFYMAGVEGRSLHGIKRILEHEGIPSPRGGKYWHQPSIKNIVCGDIYVRYTFDEVRKLVAQEVASKLDPDKCYGIWWWGRRKTKRLYGTGHGRQEGKRYTRRRSLTYRDHNEWIALPVPDAGIPREWVETARGATKDNRRPSNAGHRFWELSGGIIHCGGCGCRMRTQKAVNPAGKKYFYYSCPTRARYEKEACPEGRKNHNAPRMENLVWEAIRDYLQDPVQLRSDLERMIELEREGMRGDPEKEAKVWASKLAELDLKRTRFQHAYAEDAISLDDLKTRLAELDEERKLAKRELATLKDTREYIDELERDAEAVLEEQVRMTPEALDTLAPEERHQFYKLLRLKVVAYADGIPEIQLPFSRGAGCLSSEKNSTPLRDRNSVSRWQEDHPGCVYTTTFISAMLVSSLLVCAVSRRPTCLAAGQPTHKGYPAPSSGVHRHA